MVTHRPDPYNPDMGFDVAADSYGRFMGRYAEPLAGDFALFAGVAPGYRVLDVGCGPGALTERLVAITGAGCVAAVDPSAPFVAATARRCPGVDVHAGVAESLPFAEAGFDVALAQLVVHFMEDPVAGLREMARVTRPGGTIAACVWDHAGGNGPLSTFWSAVNELHPEVPDESRLAGSRRGHLGELCTSAGLEQVEEGALTVRVEYATFDEWWEPYTLGVGPGGDHVAGLDRDERDRLRDRCRELLPTAPFAVDATAWAVRATRPSRG